MDMKCQTEGCEETEIVHCWVHDLELDMWHHCTYCTEHCHENGFCYCCGSFWGGIESFDFMNPSKLCEHCLDQIESDLGDCDEGYDEYCNDYDDDPYNR